MYENVSFFLAIWLLCRLQFYIVNLFILQDACVHLKLEEAASKLSESADRSIDSFDSESKESKESLPRHMAVKPLHVAWHVASAQLPQLLGAQSPQRIISPDPNGSANKVSIIVALYLIYIVWSWCEETATGCSHQTAVCQNAG